MLFVRVVVIGAGIVGASVAYHAVRLGASDVLVVDADLDGRATSAGAGIVCPWSARETDPLADAAAAYYPSLVGELGSADVGYRRVGALRLGADADAIRARATVTAGEIRDIDDARELFPVLSAGVPAVYISGAARVDGRLMRAALLDAALRSGAVVRSGRAAVVDSRTVSVDGDMVSADVIVVAAGAWCPELVPAVRVSPQRGQIMHLRLPSDVDTSMWPVVLPQSSHYLVAFGAGRIVVGATREAGSGFDYRVTAAGLAEVLGEALAVAPGLADATVVETRIGFRPVGPDALPLLGIVDGVVVATGLGAGGLTSGPYVGRLAAALALGVDTGVDVTPFDPVR